MGNKRGHQDRQAAPPMDCESAMLSGRPLRPGRIRSNVIVSPRHDHRATRASARKHPAVGTLLVGAVSHFERLFESGRRVFGRTARSAAVGTRFPYGMVLALDKPL